MTDTEKNKLFDTLRRIDNQLSPENLSCDGELRPTEIARRAEMLNTQRDNVIKELGYEPTHNELYPQ